MASARHYGRSARDIANVMQRLQDEQEAVQKRTFTKWINSHLAKHDPPLVVTDLYEDIKDGVMLLALLEVLSGQTLPCEQGRKLRRIHWLANVGTALHFLEGRRSVYRGSPIKLVNINTTDVVDGRPSIVLGLIWTIILYFQIEELTSTLPPQNVQTSSTSSVDSSNSTEANSPPVKRKPRLSFQGGAKKALLKWVQKTATKRLGLDVRDFGPSWRSGIAFHAVIFAMRPQLVDMERVWNQPNRANLEEAFSLAERELGIPRLLDPEDVDVDKPDEKSIMTYVAQFLKHHPDAAERESFKNEDEREQRSVLRELKVWADQMIRDCTEAQADARDLGQHYQVFKHYRVQYEMRRRQVESCIQSVQKDGMLTSDQALVKQAWERLTARLLDWHMQLDGGLPDPLGSIGVWLHQAEKILREDLVPEQSHEETANAIHRTRQLHQEVLGLCETHQQTFRRFHRDRSVAGVLLPAEQLQDMAERLNYVSTSSHIHLSKLQFWESRYRMLGFLSLGESKLKSWIIKYGRRESTELLLQSYVSFVEGEHFFQKYDSVYEALKQGAVLYISADVSVEKRVKCFLRDVADQWRSLAVEMRSVRSMLEEVQENWERYSNCVASLQAWLEDAEGALRQPENSKREFFRTLSHWMENHATMNAAGNFLIETCDETVARDLKHQLLLLNGRWRDLFSKAKQYAHVLETHSETELRDAITALREFLETSTSKLTSPVQVSLPDVRTFVRNVQEIKHRLPAMEVRYKTSAHTAQLWTRDSSGGDGKQVLTTMASIKGQLYKMKEKCPLVLRECHIVLPVLEELEGQISAFYQIADHAGHIIAQQHDQHRNQELLLQQQSCKQCVCAVERSYLALQRALCCTKTLYNFDASLLQNRVTELQTTAQALMQEALEWRRVAEANGNLTRRFEETRAELEKTLRVGQACLTERGDPAKLFSKHSDFFSRLDQRVLNAYLKACDDLTDILPEEEQQGLQESVRRLHKQWKDIQAQAPAHLLRLRVEVERRLVMASLQECRVELQREEKMLATSGSERAIREHMAFFRNKNPISACQRRLMTIEQLCQKLPENDPVQKVLLETTVNISEVKDEVERVHLRLQEHPDKWSEWHCRFGEVSAWISSQQKDGESVSAVQREVQRAQEDALSWLTARLEVLEELSTDAEAVARRTALDELTQSLTTLLSSLDEAMSLDENSERGEDEEDVLQMQEHSRILNAESVMQARQLLLIHQQKLKSQQLKRKGCVCEEESREDCSWAAQEKHLQATVSAWQGFEQDREAVWQFVCSATPVLQKVFLFSSLENLTYQLDYAHELHTQTGVFIKKTESLVKKACEIQLGSENSCLLRDQATAAQRRLKDLQENFRDMISELREAQTRWQHFSRESEALSSWLCEREKELEAVDSNTAALERQIHTVEVIEAGLEEKKDVLTQLEAESRALTCFIVPAEAEHIKACLVQIVTSWEKLTSSVKRRGAELQASLMHRMKLNDDIHEVKDMMQALAEKFNKPVTGCASTSETYQVLHEHMELWQALKLLQPRLVSFSLGLQRISYKDQMEKEVSDLQQAHIQCTNKAASKQAKLEDLLNRWQQYERGLSVLQGWLDSSENLCKSDTPYLITDKTKLQSQLQTLQDLQSEVPSQESLLEKLETQAEFLYPTASEEHVGELTELHCNLEERWCSVSVCIPLRIQELQAHLSHLDQFNQVLMTLMEWIENFHRQLRHRSKVTITNLTAASTQIKDDEALLQTQYETIEDLNKHVEELGPSLAPLDLQQLRARQQDCHQPFSEARIFLQNRSEALVKLESFLETYRSTTNVLQTMQSVVGQENWDQTRDSNLNQELEQLSQELASVEVQAINLDNSLNKACLHLHLCDGDRTSCRGLVENLGSELQQIQRSMGTRQSESEALEVMWSSFTRRKELLLRSLSELEDKARKPWLPEPSTQNFQQRLWMLNQLEEELNALQHSQLWLEEKGEQLAHQDPEKIDKVQKDVTLVQTSWEKIRNAISEEQEQCRMLVEMCKDYQTLKYKLGSVVERAHGVTVSQNVQENPEDIQRALTRLEAVKSEFTGSQDDLNSFICKSKSFIGELRNLPESIAEAVRLETDTIVDQWMDTSKKTETESDRLRSALELWTEVTSIVTDVECWSATLVSEFIDGPVNLLSSANMEECLSQFKLEIEGKKVLMESLQGKVTRLQEVSKNQQNDIELQALAADLRIKIFHAEEVYEQAASILRDFSCQSQQLQDAISQLAEQLDSIESRLSELSQASDPENVAKIKELQKTLKQVDSGLEVTGESLRVLCRAYPAQQLTALGTSITELVKRSEAADQRSVQILRALQETLVHSFNELTQDFHSWLSELRAGTEEISEGVGDVPEPTTQLQRLQVSLQQLGEGEERLSRIREEKEKLLKYLSKSAAGGVQERLASCQLELDGFTAACRQRVRSLEQSAALQDGLEVSVDEMRHWLRQMEKNLHKEAAVCGASQPGVPDCSAQLKRVAEIHKELLVRRPSVERLYHASLLLSEVNSVPAELLSSHQALLQEAWSRLHHLQEYQAFGEVLRAMGDWLEEVKGRLEILESTEGNRKEVEERLERVQDILLMKGEGEIKLNMAAGKGELVIKSSGDAGQEVIGSKLKEVEDAWAALLLRAMSCHSRLEWTVSQWGLFVESQAQLRTWLEQVEAEVKGPLEPQLGLREKRQQLDRLCLLSADVEDHQGALCYLEESAAELYKRTGDPTFKEEETAQLREQFDDVRAAAEERVRFSEGVVFEHEKYMATVRELTDWLMSKGEELQRCSDPSGDSASIERRLMEVRVRKLSKYVK